MKKRTELVRTYANKQKKGKGKKDVPEKTFYARIVSEKGGGKWIKKVQTLCI